MLLFLLSPYVEGAHLSLLYPDSGLTPGKANDKVGVEQVCKPGYTDKVRDSSIKTRKEVFKRYGLDWADHADYEVDHFYSLFAGGTNDIENLWPQPYCPLPRKAPCMGAREKDVVEQYLKRAVCVRRKFTLKEARAIIKKGWVECYNLIKSKKECSPN